MLPNRLVLILASLCALPVALTRAGQPSLVDENLADTTSFATSIDENLRRPATNDKVRMVETVLPAMTNPNEWRFHPRQGGLLVAIPVSRNLHAAEKYGGEKEILDVIERLIRQRGINGRFEVVFIEPAARVCPAPACGCAASAVVTLPIAACDCR